MMRNFLKSKPLDTGSENPDRVAVTLTNVDTRSWIIDLVPNATVGKDVLFLNGHNPGRLATINNLAERRAIDKGRSDSLRHDQVEALPEHTRALLRHLTKTGKLLAKGDLVDDDGVVTF